MQHCNNIRTNLVLSANRTVVDEEQVIVSLEDMKKYLKMEGIDDDDDVIQDMIYQAVEWVENYCGICVREATVSSMLQVLNGIELPFGPVKSIQQIGESEFDPVADKYLFPVQEGYIDIFGHGIYLVDYTSGYDNVPYSIRQAIKAYVAYVYEHRGDDLDETSTDFAEKAKNILVSYRRITAF